DDAGHELRRDALQRNPASVEPMALDHPLDHQEGHGRRHKAVDRDDQDRPCDAEYQHKNHRPTEQAAKEIAASRGFGASGQAGVLALSPHLGSLRGVADSWRAPPAKVKPEPSSMDVSE